MMLRRDRASGSERFRDGGICNDLQRELKVRFIKRIWSHVFAL
jgi:hypothetical protein